MKHCHGNPIKVEYRWVNLLLCEGALEHLIKSLNTEEHKECKEHLNALRHGVTNFLQQYGADLHAVILKTINRSASWFKELYANYRLMVEIGRPLGNRCYGPETNMDLGKMQLFLPSRFAK